MCALQLMKITGYTDENYTTAFSGQPYTFMLNPDTVRWQRSIEYAEKQSPGTSTPSWQYKHTAGDTLSFDVVIDCTGIVNNQRTSMNTEIEALAKIVYTYNGKIHRPNYVSIQWGQNFMFKGVLTSFDTSYNLFSPDGNPLRAKISLTFRQYLSEAAVAEQDEKKSPDISQLVTVEEGMTLPQLCNQVWHNDAYCVQAARYNNLNRFRTLKGVQQLIFPPIVKPV
jgi:Contractile injection system tube protein